MKIRSLTLATGAAAALVLAGVAPVLAQPAPAMPEQQDIGEVSDTEVAQFASATVRVDQIVQDWNVRLQAADEQEQPEMQMQAQEDLVEAVEAEGLSVERYNQLAMAAQTDADLAGHIAARMQ